MKPTTRNLRSLPDGMHCLERGVYLRVREGRGAWIFRYAFGGKRKDISLGTSSNQTIPGVLAKAATYRAMLAEGKDPAEAKRVKKAAEEKAAIVKNCPTFDEFIEPTVAHVTFLRQFATELTTDGWRRTLRAAAKHLGKMRLDAITRDDVAAACRTVWTTQPRTARDWHNRLNGLFEFARSQGYIEKNPAEWKGNLDALLPSLATVRRSVPEKHHAALSAEDLKAVVARLRASEKPIDKALLFGILTVGRLSEWRLARWDEIDEKKATLSVPQARRKDKKPEPFVVPLSRQAMAILETVAVTPGCPLVFEGSLKGVAFGPVTLLKRILELTDKPVTIHGTRSTFADWCARNGKNFLVSEKCLMHAVGGKVFMAYQRDNLLEQRRGLLQEWADFLYGED